MPWQEQLDRALFSGVGAGHWAVVELLVNRSANLERRDEQWRTPLHEGVSRGRTDLVENLLRLGPNVTAEDELGWTPLHYAALQGEQRLAELLLSAGVPPDSTETLGCTPLHHGARRGHMDMLQLLLDRGASPHLVDNEGRSAAQWARLTGHDAAAAFLDAAAGVGPKGGFEQAEVLAGGRAAGAGGAANEVDKVAGGDAPRRQLLQAAMDGDEEMLLHALAGGASLRATDPFGATALHLAAAGGHGPIVEAVLQTMADQRLPLLLEARDRWSRTALLAACESRRGDTDVVAALLGAGAAVDATDGDGRTALHWAMLRGHADVASVLRSHGADPTAVDRWGKGQLHLCAFGGQLRLLRKAVAARADVNARDHTLHTPLDHATVGGHLEIFDVLVKARATFNHKDALQRTPLHSAALTGHTAVTASLLNLRASAAAVDADGRTPADLAAESVSKDRRLWSALRGEGLPPAAKRHGTGGVADELVRSGGARRSSSPGEP